MLNKIKNSDFVYILKYLFVAIKVGFVVGMKIKNR